ncbi:MAG: Gfo/Idh/MocA family oxidoreductase, partial [Planctomycetota bacterium]
MTSTRRHFVKGAAAAFGAAAVPAPLAAAGSRILGSNDAPRIAVIGVRGRGGNHIEGLEGKHGARVVALCDADRTVLAQKGEQFEKKYGRKVALVQDYRELLDDPEIDVISIATQNHWHALMAIQACQAGKDVYVEKPVSHNIWEGRQLVRAAEKYGRIVQCGTQSRSNPGLQEAVAFVQNGGLGEIRLARGLCYKPRPSIGHVTNPSPIPDSVDYDLWCGPAAMEPLMRRNLHYDWHWVWATGNGDLG